MKARFLCLLSIVGLVISLGPAGRAQSPGEVVQEVGLGGINWTRGTVYAFGEWAPPDDEFGKPVDPAHAIAAARANLLKVIKSIRISRHTRVANFSNQRGTIFQEIQNMAAGAAVANREYLSDGTLKLTLEMGIWGSFAQLLMPSEIRQVDLVQLITPKHTETSHSAASQPSPVRPAEPPAPPPNPLTGLVLDARGTGVKPAMVLLVRDESGREVYGPAFVSREFVVQRGMCLYLGEMTAIRAHPRVRFNPLVIQCLPPTAEASTDLRISDGDADRLRSAAEHLAFLREGRVIVVMD